MPTAARPLRLAFLVCASLFLPRFAPAAFETVASTSYLQAPALGRVSDFFRLAPGAEGTTAFLATLPSEGGRPAILVNRRGTLTAFRPDDFGAISTPPGLSPFLALAATQERVVVAVPTGGAPEIRTRVFAIERDNAIIPLGDLTELFASVGTAARVVDLVAQPDGTVALLVLNQNPRPLPLNFINARIAVLRDNTLTTIAASGATNPILWLSQLTTTANALYFLGQDATSTHLYRWREGQLTRILASTDLVAGAPLQFTNYRAADDGAVAIFDEPRRRIVLVANGSATTLVSENTTASGTPILFTPTTPGPRVLHVDATHVYFAAVRRVELNAGFLSPQADVVFRVARSGGAPEVPFDPDRVFARPATVLLSEIQISGATPEVTILAREFNGSHQAIFRGRAPFGTARLPAVPAGFPEFHLEDRGSGYSRYAGVPLALRVETTGTAPTTFAWSRNNQPIAADSPLYAGATGPTLTLLPFSQPYHQGTYTAAATNAAGTTFATSIINVDAFNNADGVGVAPPLVNISVRGFTGAGDRTLTAGIALLPRLLSIGFRDGANFRDYETGTTRRVLVRAIGPGLAPFVGSSGLPASLRLALFDGERAIATNDAAWSSIAGIDAATTAAGAFPLPPPSRDAALLLDLEQKNYTAQVTAGSGEGTALIELYAIGGPGNIRNVSARAHVTDAEPQTLTLGFVIGPAPEGLVARSILLRAVGPGLQRLGVATASPRPRLELFQGTTRIAANDDHRTAPNAVDITRVGESYGAFAFETSQPDAALLLSLPPGAYTARITAAPGAAGIVLAELYTNISF